MSEEKNSKQESGKKSEQDQGSGKNFEKSQELEKNSEEQKHEERIVRILSTDVEGRSTIYAALAKVKGISWAVSNAICKKLNLDKKRKVGSFTEKGIKELTEFIQKNPLPDFLKNRQKDFDSGEDKHLITSDLDLRKDFDIKRLKKIKNYRGLRHLVGLPTKGQRTRSNFRKNRSKGTGIKKKKKAPEAKQVEGVMKK